MQIDLSKVDRTNFLVHESSIYGEPMFLIQPTYMGCAWDRENRIFRSSIWDAEGNPVSLGFQKFVNFGEAPEVFPLPTSLRGCTVVDKLDGSLLIVSKWKGRLILRTRGTFSAEIHDNGNELVEFREKIVDVIDQLLTNIDTWPVSYLFEWTSPTNRIILSYGDKPEFYLVGQVFHKDYHLATQENLDDLAEFRGWKRPTTYTFNSLEDLLSNVEALKGREGVCLYSKDDQEIHKCKSDWYRNLHSLKSEISNIEKLVDVYLTWEKPRYEEFRQKIVDTFDYELFTQIQGDISKICEAKKEADQILDHMRAFVYLLKVATRKDAALSIIGAYGQTIKTRIAFNLLDGKEPDGKSWKKLIMQSLGR